MDGSSLSPDDLARVGDVAVLFELLQDILHYRRFVTAMQLMIPEMEAVDGTIAQHGGWPEAFAEA